MKEHIQARVMIGIQMSKAHSRKANSDLTELEATGL